MKEKQQNLPTYKLSNLITSNQGQTLIEVIVAVGIIVMVLGGVLALGTVSIRMGTTSRQRIQAINLAQEGMEAVRNIRDTNWLTPGNPWDKTMTDGKNKVSYDASNNRWKLTGGEDQVLGQFIREINIGSATEGGNKRQITVTVSWPQALPLVSRKKVELIDYLTNWKQ